MPRRSPDFRSDLQYAVRVRRLGAAACVLGVLVVLARLPPPAGFTGEHTYHVVRRERVELESIARRSPEVLVRDAPVTVFQEADPAPPGTAIGAPEGTSDEGDRLVPLARPIERIVLASAEQMPLVRGGIGAYYLHIEYPREAIEAGIQGRLVLAFVVEADGTPSDISIYAPLHPLCDSAAVRALRRTSFIPGMQNGRPVTVKMHLPVVFRLIQPDQSANDSTGTH